VRDEFGRVESNGLRGNRVWIQEDTERSYSQTEYGKNALVVGERGNSENPRRCTLPIPGDGVSGMSLGG
jgi:hypothetical protein